MAPGVPSVHTVRRGRVSLCLLLADLDDLLIEAPPGLWASCQELWRGLSEIGVHGVQVLETLDVYKIIGQMALRFIARYLRRLLLHQAMLMVEPPEALVVGVIDGIGPGTFLLNTWNLIILAVNDHFLVLLAEKSVLLGGSLLSRNLEPCKGQLQLLSAQFMGSQSTVEQPLPLGLLVGTSQRRGHGSSCQLPFLVRIPERHRIQKVLALMFSFGLSSFDLGRYRRTTRRYSTVVLKQLVNFVNHRELARSGRGSRRFVGPIPSWLLRDLTCFGCSVRPALLRCLLQAQVEHGTRFHDTY